MSGEVDLVLATHNRGKVEELRALLPAGVRVVTAGQLGIAPPAEIGATIEANARLKALAVSSRTTALTLADDSGLDVEALGGRPGVDSANYAGGDHDDAANIDRVLSELAGVPPHQRGARIACSIAVARDGAVIALSRGECAGRITEAPRGRGGFGDDPIFELPNGRTLAELRHAEKNRISHRARAIHMILPTLVDLLNGRRHE